MGTITARHAEQIWKADAHTSGWEYCSLRSVKGTPFHGPSTVVCKCGAQVTYDPWISNDVVEFLVLSGTLTVNGVDLEVRDYARVEAKTEGLLQSSRGMEALCVVHDKVIWGNEVIALLTQGKLVAHDAQELTRLPWIDHLRKRVEEHHVAYLTSLIAGRNGKEIRELCISMARNVSSPELVAAVRGVLAKPDDMSMRISACLFLAAKGEISKADWAEQLLAFAADSDGLLAATGRFYEAATPQALETVVRHRVSSGNYTYNQPFYDLLLKTLERKSKG